MDGTQYSYGFAATEKRITEEWLYATPEKSEVRLFERATDEAGVTTINPGPRFVADARGKRRVTFLAEGLEKDRLFLSVGLGRGYATLQPVGRWFREVLKIVRAESIFRQLQLAMRLDEDFRGQLASFLRRAGTGVDGIAVEEKPIDVERVAAAMPDSVRSEFERDVSHMGPDDAILLNGRGEGFIPVVRGTTGAPCRLEIVTHHENKAGLAIAFAMDEESEGTQRLFHLFPAVLEMHQYPRVFIIDELERRLHTLLSRYFVSECLTAETAHGLSQLIFTTHDTNLLDQDLLRRDEIWFAEKDRDGATHLASLAEWKVRPDLELEKGYLQGRFGAVPFPGGSHLPQFVNEAGQE